MNPRWNKIVIKVGSALIAPNNSGCSSQFLLSIANFIVQCRLEGIQVVLVSSGSVAAGKHLFEQLPGESLALRKAMAAAGQSEMMATWDKLFDFNIAQVLLTHADLKNKERYESVKSTINTLTDNGILPVVNENDAVTTDKFKIGDNDNLSAMVAAAVGAEALIICSDIDGLYNENPKNNPNATLISNVKVIDDKVKSMATGSSSGVGTGGMITKLEAAEKAISSGVDTYIVNGTSGTALNSLLQGANPGTLFHAYRETNSQSSLWMRHAARVHGELVVDDEYQVPEKELGESLSPDDLIKVNGNFDAGDVVLLRKDNGEKLAKVQTKFSSCLLQLVAQGTQQNQGPSFDYEANRILSETYIDLTGA